MKIRVGFVSNSSSSSFLIYGAVVSDDTMKHELEKEGLSEIYGQDDTYIGLSWDQIKDDESGAQFKQRIRDAIKKVCGPDVKCQTFSESWYDG